MRIGIVHGGASASVMDEFLLHEAELASGSSVVTLSLTLHYLSFIPLSTHQKMLAKVMQIENKKLFVEGVIMNPYTEIVSVKGSAVFLSVNWRTAKL
jgi:acyl-coenzyme A thioesterase PaaI-like protein